jgi:hypothetical protein
MANPDEPDFEDGRAEPRQSELPWQHPKPAAEDPGAPARVRALIDSPVYREAENDPDFLALPEARAPRLALDYLKPETLLNKHGIRRTIVVFGSTRIPEPDAARRVVATLREECRAAPADADLARRLAIAERRLDKSRYYTIARELGRLVGEATKEPRDGRVVIMTGGGPGIMEAANRGAFDAGAETVGLNITLPHEQYPNPYITPELCFRFHYFALRKLHFLMRARALVAFPGGYGTLDEVFETLTLLQTRKIAPLPVVLVGAAYWRRLVDFDFLVDEGTIEAEDADLFVYAETAAGIWQHILDWHTLRGAPLL